MRTIVVYRTKYGHTRSYAEWLAESLGAELAELGAAPALDGFDAAVLLCPIYIGKLRGADRFMALAAEAPATALVAATVSGAPPETPGAQATFTQAIEKGVPEALRPRIAWFHLRGGMDYPRMSFGDRLLMRFPLSQQRKQQRECGEEPLVISEVLKSVEDFRDRAALDPIIEHVRGLEAREAAAGE